MLEVDKIVIVTLDKYNLNWRELTSQQRTKKHFMARYEIAKKLRERGWSYPRIGRLMHRDHTSIMYLLGHLGTRKPKFLTDMEQRG